ncbi:MAG TPA: hypothetical protein VEH10_06730 [Thermoplasmata archaeon]|nr:hypothetical protein [Thermoplasmata archaeon]
MPGERPAEEPRVFRTRRGEALDVRSSPTGDVGRLYTGEGIEAVWVRKDAEQVDPDWFVQRRVDLITVLQGQLRVEFDRPGLEARTLGPGDCLVLPGATRCRAYRWPRETTEPTLFLAVYPTGPGGER